MASMAKHRSAEGRALGACHLNPSLPKIKLFNRRHCDCAVSCYGMLCYTEVPAKESEVWYDCCPDTPWSRITFTFRLRRKSLYYVINLVMPCCLFYVISVLTFVLQPSYAERLGLGTKLHVFRSTSHSAVISLLSKD